jgi:hypothetical protein
MDCLTEPLPPPYSAVDVITTHVTLPDGRCSLGFESCTEYRVRYYKIHEKFVTWTEGSIEDDAVCDFEKAELAMLRLRLMLYDNSLSKLVNIVMQWQCYYKELTCVMEDRILSSSKINAF